MNIEACTFGKVVIDGVPYTRDIIVFTDRVLENWWRKEGHSLVESDLGAVFEDKPDLFVLGCGHGGALIVPEETRRLFEKAGIGLVAMKTPKACKELNRLFSEGVDAAGGLHLTC